MTKEVCLAGISLITMAEANDSTVSVEEAKQVR
jgi:hypothetical protein